MQDRTIVLGLQLLGFVAFITCATIAAIWFMP
jgi:hypothetical protein